MCCLRYYLVNMKLTLDVDTVVASFGGISQMARTCTEAGFPITKQGIARWRSAKTIPMQAWLNLCAMTAQDGKVKLDLRKYLVTR